MGLSGLVVDLASELDVDLIIRGIRNSSDIDYEYQMAAANRQMTGIETLFMPSAPQYVHINATLVREIGANGGSLKGFVPESIEKLVSTYLQK